ncbi:helix-turn-helix domain-containing protein [Streptomyces sp. NPDC057403]|uniref:helix-turn-helix domain-containing protein n=1 Tax=Streptomyces sp. NPDC057403 TaxID=3346119 RepID=UPI0036BBCBD5
MILLRRLLGDVLRRQRQRQGRTLREVSSSARVSLGYLSEVERGQKEASSELLAAICDALDVRMSELMREVSDELALAELAQSAAASPAPVRPMLGSVSVTGVPPERVTIKAPAEAVDVVAA